MVDASKNNGQIGGRLKTVAEHDGSAMTTSNYSQGYTYDEYGNRRQSANTTLGLPAVASTEIVASTNRFIGTGSTPTTYDYAGNITQDTKFVISNMSTMRTAGRAP